MISPEFLSAFRSTYGCMDECCCGRWHYDLEGRWDWEEGEVEAKRKLIEQDPDKYLAKTEDSWVIDVLGKQCVVGCPCETDERLESLLLDRGLDRLHQFTKDAVAARDLRRKEEADQIERERIASLPAIPAGWQLIETAPKNSTWFEAITGPGATPVRVHYGEDLSGEEQPPFKGFFKRISPHTNLQVLGLMYWRPLPLQDRVLDAVRNGPAGQVDVGYLSWKLKIKKIAATSALRALERKGLVGRSALNDRWDVHRWFITKKAKDLKNV